MRHFVLAGLLAILSAAAPQVTLAQIILANPPPPPPPAPQSPPEFDDCNGANWCPRMRTIPAGTFQMGTAGNDGGDESLHSVAFAHAFAVGKFEVTRFQWAACVSRSGCRSNPNPSTPPQWANISSGHPVINVSWDDAQTYVRWLSRWTGRNYRLLTEAEWEYAARAGTNTTYSTGPTISPAQANYFTDNSVILPGWAGTAPQTRTVGSYPANPFGVHDMHGNVWEWVQDCYAPYSQAPVDGSANNNPAPCTQRVIRGGSWADVSLPLRSANREWRTPSLPSAQIGFRVARTL